MQALVFLNLISLASLLLTLLLLMAPRSRLVERKFLGKTSSNAVKLGIFYLNLTRK